MNESPKNTSHVLSLDTSELRQRKKHGDLCPNCRARTLFHPGGSGKCAVCDIPLIAYDPPRYPTWVTVLGLVFCFFYAFFGFLIADLSDMVSAIPYFILVTAIFVAAFAIPHAIHKNRLSEYEIALKDIATAALKRKSETPEAKAKAKTENLAPLAYYDDLFEVDHAFRSEGVMRERFLSGVCPPGALPLRRSVSPSPTEDTESLGTLVEYLYRYAALCGLHLTLQTVEEILMAMASTRLIYLEAENGETVRDTVKLLSGFFDSMAHATPIDAAWKSTYDMLGVNVERSDAARTGGATGLLVDLYGAKYNPEHICVTLLENVGEVFLALCLDPFVKSLGTDVMNFDKNMKLRLKLGSNIIPLAHLDENSAISLPNNMWFFCTKAEENPSLADVPQPAHPVFSATVRLKTEPNEAIINHFPCATKPISHARFAFLCEQTLEEHFLSEPVWQKCDVFFAFLEKEIGVKVGNKAILKIEDRSSLALAFFGDKEEISALDHALALCLGKKLRKACEGNEEKRALLVRTAAELFGENALSATLAEIPTA